MKTAPVFFPKIHPGVDQGASVGVNLIRRVRYPLEAGPYRAANLGGNAGVLSSHGEGGEYFFMNIKNRLKAGKNVS